MRCWYTRWQMSNALDRGELAARMDRGHPAGCAACRAFGHALASLHARLGRDAHAAAVPVRAARRVRRPWLVAAPVAACAAAAIVVAVGAGRGPAVAVVAPDVRAPDPLVLVRVRGVADRVSQVLGNTPLEAELDDLLHDGRRGLDAVLAAGGLRRPR